MNLEIEIDFSGDDKTASLALTEFTDWLEKMQLGGELVKIECKSVGSRSSQENRAIHLGLKHAKQDCDRRGITKDVLFSKISKGVEFPVTEEDLKEVLRGICYSLYGEWTTTAIPQGKSKDVWDIFSMACAKRLGVDVGDYPSMESLRINSMLKGDVND